MGFRTNFKEADQGNGIKPEGYYECLIVKVEEKQTKNGAWGLNFSLVVRNDVGQKYGNSYIFYTIWRKREPTENDRAVKGYNFGQLMALARAAGMTDGKDYDTLEQFCGDLVRKCVRVKIEHEEYNGKTFERVNEVTPTQYPDCRHVFKNAAPAQGAYAQPAPQTYAQPMGGYDTFETFSDDGVPF